MSNRIFQDVGIVACALLTRGVITRDDPEWELCRDDKILSAVGLHLDAFAGRISVHVDRIYLVASSRTSPLIAGNKRISSAFPDNSRDDPGRVNLTALIALMILGKVYDADAPDQLSQAGRGGVIPIAVMVDEVERDIRRLSARDDLAPYMRLGIDIWDRCTAPATGHANIKSHDGWVRRTINILRNLGLLLRDESVDETGTSRYFKPSERLKAQLPELYDSARFQEIFAMLDEDEED